MSDLKKDFKFTAIANEILDNICKVKLNGTQFRIILAVWRYTYGFNRKDHELSEGFIADATGINKRQIQRELKKLIEDNVLIVTKKHTCATSKKLKFNKKCEMWRLKRQVTKKTPPDVGLDTSSDVGLDTTGDVFLDTSSDVGLDTQERKKDNIKDNIKDKGENVFTFYKKNFGIITSFITEDIGHFLDDGVEENLIIKALQMSLEKNANSWSYAKGILTNSFKKNIKTLEQFSSSQIDFKNNKSQNQPNGYLPPNAGNFDQREYTKEDFTKFEQNEWMKKNN